MTTSGPAASGIPLLALRPRLRAGEPLASAMMMVPDPAVAAIMGRTGFDYVVLDAEHGAFTIPTILACVEALQAAGTAAVVRPGSVDATEIKRILDLGADGVLVPAIEDADQARAAVEASRYPPEGRRGATMGARAQNYGSGPFDLAAANAAVAVLVVLETGRGVENAAEIAGVPGVDGVFIGPYDLSIDLGVPGRFDDPVLVDAAERVLRGVAGRLPVATNMPAALFPGYPPTLVNGFSDSAGIRAAASSALAAARAELAGSSARHAGSA